MNIIAIDERNTKINNDINISFKNDNLIDDQKSSDYLSYLHHSY